MPTRKRTTLIIVVITLVKVRLFGLAADCTVLSPPFKPPEAPVEVVGGVEVAGGVVLGGSAKTGELITNMPKIAIMNTKMDDEIFLINMADWLPPWAWLAYKILPVTNVTIA